MYRLLLAAALLASTLISAEPWRFEPRHIEEKIPGCDDPKQGCVHAEFNYLEAVGGSPTARERVNTAIRDLVLSRPGDSLNLTPAEYAKHFVATYEKVKREGKSLSQRWSLSKTLKVLRDAPPVLCIEYSEESYTGGAHGNFGTQYLNFDAATGERVKLRVIVKDEEVTALTSIAEAHFRSVRSIAPGADLKQAGFLFADNRFQLNENFGLTATELLFLYNAYEIGPYSLGPTTIAIPFSEIRDMLRPGFLP